MEKLNFSVNIAAPREKVWKVLWDKKSYEQWTVPFSPGSTIETNWQEGSRVLFLDSTSKDGMVSEIATNKPNEVMTFRHLGMVINGKEDMESPEVKVWAGAEEKYTLEDGNGHTRLLVNVDIAEDHADFFRTAFPKALDIVKHLAESN